MHIIHRLLAAAADAKLRQDMNVEDEYFLAIENRDTAIMQRDERIKEQDKQIADQGKQIAEQSDIIISSAKLMKESGMALEQIATITRLPIDTLTKL